MKALLLLLTVLLWVAVFGASLRACDAEAAAREALDRCLYNGGTVSTCTEVKP